VGSTSGPTSSEAKPGGVSSATGPGMDASRLATWAELDRRRRAEARPALARLTTGFPLAALCGLAAAALLGWTDAAYGAVEARTWWGLAAGLATAGIVMRAPFRMYWRHDATLLARLPIPGDALYGLAARRSRRAAAQVALALVLAAVPVAFVGAAGAGGALAFARFVAVVLVGAATAALLTPPVGAFAGALVADVELQRALGQLAGESSGPPTVWLGFLPAAGGLGAGIVVWLSAPWAARGTLRTGLTALALEGGALVLAAFIAVVARRRLAAVLPAATREVAALDAVKLATLQLDTARGLEAAFGRVVAGAGLGGAVYRKDVALARRRHPMFFLSAGLALLVLWLVAAFASPATRTSWSITIVAGLALYLAIFGRRLARPTIEQPRLLGLLPVPRAAVGRAKWAFVLWRALFVVAAAAPCVWRASDRAGLALILGVALVAAVLVGGIAARMAKV
jgi:hypothetical protein